MTAPSELNEPATPDVPLPLAGREAIMAATDPRAWRGGKAPEENYHLSAVVMPQERLSSHTPGSLEDLVEKLVQGFEMEVSHNADPATWITVAVDRFRNSANGGAWHTAQDIAEQGSYNIMIGDSPFYPRGELGFEAQHDVFHAAFPNGFYWELLEVFSPPPVVTFTWRHWGRFDGEYFGRRPTGEMIEMFGMSVAKVDPDDQMRITEVQHFYNPDAMLAALAGGVPVPSKAAAGQTAPGCPVPHTRQPADVPAHRPS